VLLNQAVSPLAVFCERGQLLSSAPFYQRITTSKIHRKGGASMSVSEVLQLCLVIIGICNLFIQGKKK
jgi:hypothetical protein